MIACDAEVWSSLVAAAAAPGGTAISLVDELSTDSAPVFRFRLG
jgi:hypothetical protein